MGQYYMPLIKRDDTVDVYTVYGNRADDEVDNYKYDYIFNNSFGLERVGEEFLELMKIMVGDKTVSGYKYPTYNAYFYQNFKHFFELINNTGKVWEDHYLKVMIPNSNGGSRANDTDEYGCYKLPALKPGKGGVFKFFIQAGGF